MDWVILFPKALTKRFAQIRNGGYSEFAFEKRIFISFCLKILNMEFSNATYLLHISYACTLSLIKISPHSYYHWKRHFLIEMFVFFVHEPQQTSNDNPAYGRFSKLVFSCTLALHKVEDISSTNINSTLKATDTFYFFSFLFTFLGR